MVSIIFKISKEKYIILYIYIIYLYTPYWSVGIGVREESLNRERL